MKLLMENWRRYLNENEQEISQKEKIAELWYSPNHREQAKALASSLGVDPKELRIWKILLPRLTGRMLDSFWTFAEVEDIVDYLNNNNNEQYYIKNYQVTNENIFAKPASASIELKDEENIVFFSARQRQLWNRSQVRAFDDAAEKVSPNRFEEGGRQKIDQERIDRYYEMNEAVKRKSAAGIKKAIKDLTQQGGNTGGNPTGMKAVKRPLGDKDEDEISAPPGAPGGGSIGHGSLEEAFEKEEMSMYPWLEKIAGKSRSEVEEILKSEFKYIGGGSFRNVYSPIGDEDIVIKFVYDDNWYSRNDYMNKKEVEISSAYPRLFPKTFAHSPDFSWIAMERIEPVGDADEASFKKVIENFPKILNYIKNEMPFNIKEKFLEDLESYEGIWWFILQSLMYGGAYRQSKYKTQYSKKLSDRYQEYDIAEREYRVFYRKLFEYGMKNEKLYFMIFKAYNELELDIMDWVGGNIGLNANNELKIIDASYFAN